MTPLSQDLILSKEHAVNATHQATPFAVQIGPHLFLKRRLVKITATNGNTKGDGLLFSFAGNILVDSDRRINAAAFTEESSDCAARAFGSYQDYVDICGDVDVGQVLENRREAMGEVEGLMVSLTIMALKRSLQYLSFCQLGLDCRPRLTLSSVT